MKDHLLEPRVTGNSEAVILSDENILGNMVNFEKGLFYPAAERRLQTLYSAMGGPPERVVLVIREYSSFLRSCYRKRAQNNPVKPFRKAVPKYLKMDRGWYEMTCLVNELLKPSSLTVVNYEDRGTSVDLLKLLVPDLKDTALVEGPSSLNKGATDLALLELQKLHATGKRVPRRKIWKVVDEHSSQTDDLGFSVYLDSEENEMRLRFEQDVRRISELLEPAADARAG